MPADLLDQPASRSAARAGLGVLEGGGAGPCGLSGGLGGAVGTVGRSVCDSVRGGAFGAGGSELPGEGTEAAPRPAGTGGLAVPAADVDPGSRALVGAGAGGRRAGRECIRCRSWLCGLAGPGATATRDGRQDAARLDHQAWQQLHPAQPGAGREVSDLGGDGQGCRAQSVLSAPALDPGAARKPAHQHTPPLPSQTVSRAPLAPSCRAAGPTIRATASCRHEPLHRDIRTQRGEASSGSPGKRLQQGSFIRRIGQRRGTQR